ncbi:nucleoid-associated protein [Granulosicoccaceae sp. 1_MG-2023]|nr:nucleoid-associated protein [Granulosicoccaceae sp. 1_MG-2023]
MATSEFITHSFSRLEGGEAALRLRDTVVAPDDRVEDFVNELKHALQRRAARDYGVFSAENGELGSNLQKYLDGELGDNPFVALSVQWMEKLREVLDELEITLQGHVVFVQEEHLGVQTFYIFVLSLKESMVINHNLEVETTRYVDFGSSLMAMRAELSLWQAGASKTYLTLAAPRGAGEWGDAFRALCGFENTVDKKSETSKFLEAVSGFSMELPDDKVTEFQSQVVDFCIESDKRGEAVAFDELGGVAREVGVDADKFVEKLAETQPADGEKIHVDRNSLKKFMRYVGREKDLAVSFSSAMIPERVVYDKDKDELTIKGLPKTLRKQLLDSL